MGKKIDFSEKLYKLQKTLEFNWTLVKKYPQWRTSWITTMFRWNIVEL